jgi:WD40 repeat protein
MGTPQYMSPEQAMGMVAELDQRSDIYSLGGILYAILTLRPPIDGTTLDEVLTKVKNGSISAMVTKRGGKGPVTVGAPTAMGAEVPEALQAVTLKAMATHRDKRYASVEAFASDIERYQNGFATQAEDARAWKRIKLWMLRNKVLAASAAILLVSAVTFTLRLAASERVARTNEQKALKEKDASRRSAANAQIALAEAAESASDAPAIVRALSEVPEDLRGADWHYLQERIDASDFTVVAPDGGFWIGAENIPADPDRIVALSSSHDLYEVNVKTGAMQRLWNFSPERGHSFGPMSVSKDGKLVALGYWKAAVKERAFFCVNVCQLEDGTRVGQLGESEIDTASTLTRLIVSGELCVIDGKKKSERRVEAWDFWSGKRMWDAVGTHADFSEDQKSVFLINSQDTAEKRDARSGAVQVTGAPGAIRFHANFTENGMGSADWGKFFTPLAGYSKLRVMDPWTGTVSLEVAPTHGNYGSAIVPSANLFAVLGRTSGEGSVLEIRDVWSGLVRHVYPVPVRLGSGANQAAKILAKADAVAVRFQRVIKIWRFDVNTPSKLSLSGKETARLGDTGRVVRLKQEADKNILEVIDETQSDKKKQIIQELDISEAEKLISNVGSSGRIKCSADGERVIRQRDYFLSAYRNSPSGLVRLWGPLRPKSGQGMGDVVLHPNLDLFWSGGSVREFSSGRDLVQIDRSFKGGVFRGRGAVWVGSSRVAEIADPEGGDTESVDASLEAQQLLLWDANAGQIVLKMDAPKADCLCVSPDALWIAEGGSDKRVRIRSSRTLEVEQDFRVHQDGVTGIAWHPTLPLLVTASNDGTIRIWNLTDKRKVEEIKAIPKRAITLEISASGFELVEYMSNGTSVRILKPRSFQP